MKKIKEIVSRKPVRVLLIICFIIIIYSIIWYFGMCHQYVMWHIKMYRESGSISADVFDEEGYCRAIHYPYYLNWQSGNLSVSSSLDRAAEIPESGEKPLYVSSSGLIIWLKPFCGGVDEVGVILLQGDTQRQIYLEDNETARYPDDQPYVDAGRDEINKLFRKAEEEWDIEMPWKES